MELRAFNGDKAIKAKYMRRIRAHAAADEIEKGHYWEGGKGCAVGCTIHGSDHSAYERELGIPQSIAKLEDTLFENLSNGEAKKFPVQFLSAIKPGADLSRVTPKFLLVVQKRNLARIKKASKRDEACEKAVEQVIAVLLGWVETGKADESAAESAARSAGSAAWAAESAAESAAWAAAESAAWAAGSAAWAAESAAESAARSAAESAAWAARSAAWAAEYSWMAKTLLKLLREAT